MGHASEKAGVKWHCFAGPREDSREKLQGREVAAVGTTGSLPGCRVLVARWPKHPSTPQGSAQQNVGGNFPTSLIFPPAQWGLGYCSFSETL